MTILSVLTYYHVKNNVSKMYSDFKDIVLTYKKQLLKELTVLKQNTAVRTI